MELIRGVHNIGPQHRGCVLTIGNFDGVHLGHQSVLKGLKERAQQLALATTVMSFEPQPQELFAGAHAPARLSRLRDKIKLFDHHGIDRLMCVRFDRQFANMPASEFIEKLLVEKLGVRFLVVGDDFRFGHGREGDFTMLQQAGKQFGFEVISTQSLRVAHHRVSSTLIRDLMAQGELTEASEMLGRTYSLSGRVRHGDKKGRTIGFPTANLALGRKVSPLMGVFAIQVWVQGQRYYGVANVGSRPTVAGNKVQLEAHLFDFDGDIYGQQLDVEIHHKIREEIKFDSFPALQQQIKQDVLKACSLFSLPPRE